MSSVKLKRNTGKTEARSDFPLEENREELAHSGSMIGADENSTSFKYEARMAEETEPLNRGRHPKLPSKEDSRWSHFLARQIAAIKRVRARLHDAKSKTFPAWMHKLADQIQSRYVLTREETNSRVTKTFDRLYASRPLSKENEEKARHQLRAAMRRWSRLSEDDLVHSEGNASRLISLVQTRYAIEHDEAERQVQRFMEKNPIQH